MWKMVDALLRCSALVALVLHFVVNGCSAVNTEGSALLKFQSKVEEDPHGAMAGWSQQDVDPCSWNGVHCVDGRVVLLNLRDLSLRGTLGPELGSLSHLRALVLSNNMFSGPIPKEMSGLAILEILDLSNNNLTGEVPQEIAEMQSIKHLLLSNNNFQWPLVQNSYRNFDQEIDFDIYDERGNVDQRSENGFKSDSSSEENTKDNNNLSARLSSQFAARNPTVQLSRRRLLEDTNLAAASVNAPVPAVASVPSTGTGSYSAFKENNVPPPLSPPSSPPMSSGPPQRSKRWLYAIVISSIALLLIGIACIFLLCHNKSVATIGPWKTGLSGQLESGNGEPQCQRPSNCGGESTD